MIVDGVHVGSCLMESLNDLLVPRHRCNLHASTAVLRLRLHICSTPDQPLHHRVLVPQGSEMQCTQALRPLLVDICSHLQEDIHVLLRSHRSSNVKVEHQVSLGHLVLLRVQHRAAVVVYESFASFIHLLIAPDHVARPVLVRQVIGAREHLLQLLYEGILVYGPVGFVDEAGQVGDGRIDVLDVLTPLHKPLIPGVVLQNQHRVLLPPIHVFHPLLHSLLQLLRFLLVFWGLLLFLVVALTHGLG
mmetsp:Transcript_971/g.3078  ORF Transcript_971/g.3078 Transcript_971/m.3078 type:complete len:246 (-) Transcript_971:130-867(-)